MSHVACSSKSRHFEPFSGRFTPIRPTDQRWRGSSHPVSDTRQTWLAPNVHVAIVLPPQGPMTPGPAGSGRAPTPPPLAPA